MHSSYFSEQSTNCLRHSPTKIMYLHIVLFLSCYLLTNSALVASVSAHKSLRKQNTITDDFPNDQNLTEHTKASVPQNCKFCLKNDTDCMEFDTDRCEYNIRMRIIAESNRMEDTFGDGDGSGVGKSDIDNIFDDMMVKAASDTSFKECIPFVSQYSDCYAENFCTGCNVCSCAASGQWNCMMTQKCKPRHQLLLDHQLFTVLMENMGADESDAENEGHYLDPGLIEANEQSGDEKRPNYKREISADSVINMALNDTKTNKTRINDVAVNSSYENHFSNNEELLPESKIHIPLNDTDDNKKRSTNTTNKSVYTYNKEISDSINDNKYNIGESHTTVVNSENDSYVSNNKQISGDTIINIPLNYTKDKITQSKYSFVYGDGKNHFSSNEEMLGNTFPNVSQDNTTQNNITAVYSDDENHFSYKREISTDTTVNVPLNASKDKITQSIDTGVNFKANSNYNTTNEENISNTTTIGSYITSSHSHNKGIADENVEDIKEFVLYPISEIVKEKETELNELVTIKDNLLNLLALCKKFFDANNGSRSNLSVQDNSQAFMSLYNSKILPDLKKDMSDREDLDDTRNEDKLSDDLEVLLKDIIYMQKHNFETLPNDMKSVIRSLKYYSLEFMKYDQLHRLKDKPSSKIDLYPQYRPKHHKKINCYILKALYSIFETINNSNNTNSTFKSISATPKKVLKRIINFNYYIYSPVNIKPNIEDENIIMTALLNLEGICIKYLKELRNNNSELYKLKNMNYIFAQNIAVLSEIVSIIDLPRFEDFNLSPLFAHRLQILADRLVEFLFKLNMHKMLHIDFDNKETTPMNPIKVKTSINKAVHTRSYPQENFDTIVEETEIVTVPISTIKNVTVPPNVNKTVSQNPFTQFIEFLKKAKNEVTKFVQSQLDKIKNQRNKQTEKLKEKEKHFEEVMKKWQKKLGISQKEKRSLKDVDRKISSVVSNMFSSIYNVFASQTHKFPTIKKVS